MQQLSFLFQQLLINNQILIGIDIKYNLADCYRSCLELAVENQITSIVFCCISTGVFCFPQERAAEIAVETAVGFLKQNTPVEIGRAHV